MLGGVAKAWEGLEVQVTIWEELQQPLASVCWKVCCTHILGT